MYIVGSFFFKSVIMKKGEYIYVYKWREQNMRISWQVLFLNWNWNQRSEEKDLSFHSLLYFLYCVHKFLNKKKFYV